MMNQQEPSTEEFKQAILYRRLLYLWGLRFLGYQVNDKEIEELEKEVYPDIPELDIEGKRALCQRDVDELQLLLSTVEPRPKSRSFTKAVLFRLRDTTLRMWKENNHQRPHFHIEYKKQYKASYAIDNFQRLAGDVPVKYEKPILEWAARNQKSLKLTWEKLRAGENIRELVSLANQV